MRRSSLATAGAIAALAVALLAGAAGAQGKSYTPRHHKIFHGVSDTSNNRDFHHFGKEVGAHSAILEDFYHWDTPLTTGALRRWHQTRTRGVLSLSTAPGGQPEILSPRDIANGKGDHYIVRLNQSIAASKQVVYIRLFPEMNGSWNPYSAFNANGSSKGRSHSTNQFRKAWRRIVLIVRGGKVRKINKELHQLHMPRILNAKSNHAPVYSANNVHHKLSHPRVAFMWTPQTTGSPNVHGNQPNDYWPGKHYVDWVGADIYSAYASAAFPKLKSFYRKWKGFPFLIGEYSPWDNDRSGHFTRKLFRWAERAGRTRMLIYYRSVHAGSPYDINHWPKARKVMRHELHKGRFAKYASKNPRRHHHHHHRHRHHHHHHHPHRHHHRHG
jgi:hypothetical protein